MKICHTIARTRSPHYTVAHISGPDAVWNEEEGKLFHCFHGENSQTRLATSADGIHFDYADEVVNTRIEADYATRGIRLPCKVSEKDHTHGSYESGMAMKITRQMLDETKVRVLTKDGTRISQLRASDGEFSAKVFIDATCEGDLMAAAGVSWTIGREGRQEFGASNAGYHDLGCAKTFALMGGSFAEATLTMMNR